MRVVNKYHITLGISNMYLRKGAVVIAVQAQEHVGGVLWAIEDQNQLPTMHRCITVSTGQGLPDDATQDSYVGTFQESNGQYVWHVFFGEVTS